MYPCKTCGKPFATIEEAYACATYDGIMGQQFTGVSGKLYGSAVIPIVTGDERHDLGLGPRTKVQVAPAPLGKVRKLEPRFRKVRSAPTMAFDKLEQLSTGYCRWVSHADILTKGEAEAFYDADPAWAPNPADIAEYP